MTELKQTIELSGKKFEHTISYEVMQKYMCVSVTVGTFKSYEEARTKAQEVYDKNPHVSIDLVVRDGYGTSVVRQSLLEFDACDGTQQNYSDLYGWFGTPPVYNADYKDSKNYGYEFYTKLTKQYS